MAHWNSLSTATIAALGVFALSNGASAQFSIGSLPGTGGLSENVDFADIDLDGDWDAAIADGGDTSQQVNKIYVNQGGLQPGTEGVFLYDAARFPAINDQSRDIEFVDFDNDGDADIYVSNTSQIVVQGNRWHTNRGGKQGGQLGYYVNETSIRWIGIGGAGSSIAPSQKLGDNSFIDWSCDCDFGDLDNDGDLDLFHGSYGGAFGGQVPTRLFLNDGDGHFSEFNPSGFQLAIATIANGNPGLWCEGTQQANTANSTGVNCDIASSALDIDVGDIDGDFDLDLLHGARQEAPRMFINRLGQSGRFRDVTTASFPPGWSGGSGHYEQEMGDFDGDGDLDIYGLNWAPSGGFSDITMVNNGSGVFTNLLILAGSTSDDNEGDFLDYDNDGDLDLYVANFSGQDKLYRNNSTGPGNYSYTKVSLPSFGATSLDADACDVNGDGDYDVIVAEDGNQNNTLLVNTTNVPDTHAPYLPHIENIGNFTAAAAGKPARVHVYDNAPYYITWYNPTVMNVSVNGINLPALKAMSSAGQIFRGVVPGNLVGSVSYSFTSQDEYGNTGSSTSVNVTGSTGLGFQSSYGTGTVGLTGGEPTITALSVPFAGSTAYLALSSGAPGGTAAIIGVGTASAGPLVFPGLLTLNIGGIPLVTVNSNLDANGDLVVGGTIPAGTPAGTHLFAQGWVLDLTGSGQVLASSKGLDLVTQ
jgi:hypothetical protein